MLDAFNAEIYTPLMTNMVAVDMVVAQLKLFDDATRQKVMNHIQSQAKSISIGVKKVLMICERARQDASPERRFVQAFLAEVQSSSGQSMGEKPSDRLQGLLDGLDTFNVRK